MVRILTRQPRRLSWRCTPEGSVGQPGAWDHVALRRRRCPADARTGASTPRAEVHASYESDVDSRSEASDDDYTFDFDGIDDARPRARTLRAARQAHRLLNEILVETYDGYNRRVARITQWQLERAANAVADLIASLR